MDGGYIYINENCWRAMWHLTRSDSDRRERLKKAVFDAHRPADTDFFTKWMSPETLEAWRNCLPEKPFDVLTDDELDEVSEQLTSFLFGYQRDYALREARERKEKSG